MIFKISMFHLILTRWSYQDWRMPTICNRKNWREETN